MLSDRLYPPFYALVRGIGNVGYSADIILFSRPIDGYLFLAACVLLLGFHVARLRGDLMTDPVGFVPLLGLVAGVGLYVINASIVFFALIGISGASIVGTGLSRLGRRSLTAYALSILALIAVIAVLGDFVWISNGFIPGQPLEGNLWQPALVGLQLLGLVSAILPELALLFFFSWAIRLAISLHPQGAKGWATDLDGGSTGEASPMSRWSGTGLSVMLLGVGIVIVTFVGIYPYLSSINPTGMLVSVDVTHCYSYWLNHLPGSTVCGPFGLVIQNERVGALWALQALTALFNSSDLALKASFALWGIFLVVSVYALVLEGTGDRLLAGISAVLTAVSTQVLVGVTAGTLANWLALPFVNFFFVVLLRGMKTQKLAYVIPSFALFTAILFIHPWTWALVLIVLSVFLPLLLLQSGLSHQLRSRKFEVILLGSLLGLGLASDILKSFLPMGSALSVAVETVLPGWSLQNVPVAAVTLRNVFQVWVGGAMGDPLWYVLGTVGMLSIPSLRGRFGMLLVAWVAAVSLGLVTVSSTSYLQSRFIADVPLQIFAAIGIVALLNYLVMPLQDGTRFGRNLSRLLTIVALVSVVGLFLGFALDAAGFLYTG